MLATINTTPAFFHIRNANSNNSVCQVSYMCKVNRYKPDLVLSCTTTRQLPPRLHPRPSLRPDLDEKSCRWTQGLPAVEPEQALVVFK